MRIHAAPPTSRRPATAVRSPPASTSPCPSTSPRPAAGHRKFIKYCQQKQPHETRTPRTHEVKFENDPGPESDVHQLLVSHDDAEARGCLLGLVIVRVRVG